VSVVAALERDYGGAWDYDRRSRRWVCRDGRYATWIHVGGVDVNGEAAVGAGLFLFDQEGNGCRVYLSKYPADFVVPRGFGSWNAAHRGVYVAGWRACREGLSLDDCPYKDLRKDRGGLTWSRSFQAAWRDGWFAAKT
jgi:hypothetical protein